MASNPSIKSSKRDSALMDLARFFEKARGREGRITLPKNLLDATRNTEPKVPEVYALIKAIEPAESAICNRIDAEGLVVLCWALLSSPYCFAQRRGFYLITESLYHNQSDSPEKAASKRSKKIVIGKHALHALIKIFTDLETSEQTQRWVGVLALELLENCPENAKKLSSEPARLRSLSDLFKRSNCRVFTLITGSIIRILLNNGTNPEELCLTEGDRILYSNFPRSKEHDMNWVLAFEEFVDELVMANVLIKQSDMLYAFGLDAGNIQYNSVDDSAILVTVNRDLTIVVSASPTGPATYVDVPLENIVQTKILSIWNDESQAHRYAVTIELSQIVGDHWHHNAVGQNSSTMSIAFTSQSHAEVLSELCRQSEKAWLTARAPVMESQPINCSVTAVHGQLARPNIASERLAEVALEAHLILGQDLSTGMLHNNNATLPSTFQDRITGQLSEPGTVAENHEDIQQLASSVASAVEGIDVSQRDITSRGKTDPKIQNASAHTDGPAIEVPRTVATSADIEFETSPRHGREGSIQQGQTSKSEDQGYDSSYDVSPRPSRVQSKITENAVPVVQLGALHPSGSNRILPTTGDGPIEGPPSSKLSRSLRNNNGNVETGIESVPSLGLERAAGTPIEKITASRSSVNLRVTASPKSKVNFEKSQLTKKAKKGKGRAQAPKVEARQHSEDEYDLPRSPEEQVRKSKASMVHDKPTSQATDRETSRKQITKAENVAKNPLRHSKEAKSKRIETQQKNVASRASGVHKTKPNPVTGLTQTRPRRAAALIANKKIQGLEAFDEIVDGVEKAVSISSREPATPTKKQNIKPSLTEIPKEKIPRNSDEGQASVSGDAKSGMVSHRDTLPSSRLDEDAISEASSMENVELVTITTRHGIAQAGTASEPSLPAPNPDLLVAHGTVSPGGVDTEAVGMNMNGEAHDKAPEAQNREKDILPESITMGFHALSEVEEVSIIEPDLNMDEEARPLGMVGDAEDSHFQEAMLDRESVDRREDNHGTSHSGSEKATRDVGQHSHMAREEADDADRASQHTDQASTKPENSKVTAGSSKAPDPFEAKLSLLTPDNEATTSNAKEGAALHTVQKSKASKEYIGGKQQFNEGETVESAEQVNDRLRVTQPATRDDVSAIEHQKNSSLNSKSDLNKGCRVQPRPQKVRGPTKQSVQGEQQRNVGHTQPQQAISEPNGPRVAMPAIENKRKAVRDGGAREKRTKLAPSNEQKAALQGISEGLQQAIGDTTSMSGHGKPMKPSSAEVQVPDMNRKPEIISFNTQGPMNQGSASIKKPKPRIVTGMETDYNIKAAHRNDRETLKRKPARPVDDPETPAYEQPPKRQKPDITSPNKHMHIAQMFPEPNSIIAQDKPHGVSSQSTRVDHNGSPMPSMHALNEMVADTPGYSKGGELMDDPMLPLIQVAPPQKSHIDGVEILSSNRKRGCDSPTAPSSFLSNSAHYIFHDGTLVNIQTKENIVREEPQDPFISAGQAGTSDFMLALRRESVKEARSQDALLSEKPAMNANRRLPPSHEDPDKTLVEGQRPKKQRKHDIISISSTTTSSSSGSTSSGGVSPSMDPSSEEGDANILAEWRMALQTHQRLMASVLSDISQQLLKHLAEHETNVQTVVENFCFGGNGLLDKFLLERQGALESNEAQLERIRRKLSAALDSALGDLMDTLNGVSDGRQDRTEQWVAHQRAIMGNVQQALARCTEEG